MKKLLVIAFFGLIPTTKAQQPPFDPCYYSLTSIPNDYYECNTYDDWVVVFEEQFIGSSVDYDIWENKLTNGARNNYCDGMDKSYATDDDNFEVSNGTLKIIADDDGITANIVDWLPEWDAILYCSGEPWGINRQYFEYTSGLIFSKQAFVHGIFEIRCKIPPIKRLWPAFWLYGGDCAQEIDIFEFLNTSTDPTYASKRPTYTYHREINCDPEQRVLCNYIDVTYNLSDSMHLYSVEWDEHKLIWRIDGNEVLRRYRFYDTDSSEEELCGQLNNQSWFQNYIYPLNTIPMKISAGMGVREDSHSDFPVTFEVDYIKVFQRINSNSTVQICSSSDILGSTVAGQEIVFGGPSCSLIAISDGEFLNLVAKERIVITSDFKIEEGAQLIMQIDN